MVVFHLLLCFILYSLSLNILADCMPTVNNPHNITNKAPATKENAIKHLIKYGYLSEIKTNTILNAPSQDYASLYSKNDIGYALKDYQQFMNIPVTSTLDEKTLKSMANSRCGIKDMNPMPANMKMVLTSRGKRKKRGLTYNSNGRKEFWYVIIPKPKIAVIDSIYHQMEYAFNMWASVSNLVFIRGDNTKYSDILIGFYKGDHQDNEPFDGKGGMVGHASSASKIIHFDDEENWVSNKNGDQFRWLHPSLQNNGSDFIQSAIHEIGHVLGLPHTSDIDSAMYPILQTFPYRTEYSLSKSDMKTIQNNFGICEPSKFNTIFTNSWKDGRTYIVVGPYVYQFNDEESRVEHSWPRTTSVEFPMSPKFPDEVFWGSDFFMHWFVGEEYVSYTTGNKYPMSRKKIGRGSDGVVGWRGLRESKVDAAINIWENRQDSSYIFRKDLVYKYVSDRYSTNRLQLPWLNLESGWPKKISIAFPGIPNDLDTAFTWGKDGRTYFFKGNTFQIWDPNDKDKTKTLYAKWQWRNVCDVYKCMIGPIKNYYKCESWSYTKADCKSCGNQAS